MLLPIVDFEQTYWRLRRRLQRVRATLRERRSHARAQAHLRYLCRTGKLPAKVEPEDTFAYRALWAVVIAGLLLVLAIEGIGEDRFVAEMTAVLTLGKHLGAPNI